MRSVEYIQDPCFVHGFQIHGVSQDQGYIALYPGMDDRFPQWNIAQWAVYRHPLTSDTPRLDFPGGYQYRTPSHTVTVHPQDDDCLLRLELRSSQEYGEHIRKEGEGWPHLLIDQAIPDDLPPLGQLNSLVYRAQLRLDYCTTSLDTAKFDPELHGAQIVQFFTVWDPVSDNYIWFGIPFFDTRHSIYPGYINIDGGKDDATGKLIYTSSQLPFFRGSVSCGEWVVMEADILPILREAVAEARRRQIAFPENIDNLRLTTNNLGWEMFAAYDGAFSIRELSLTGALL